MALLTVQLAHACALLAVGACTQAHRSHHVRMPQVPFLTLAKFARLGGRQAVSQAPELRKEPRSGRRILAEQRAGCRSAQAPHRCWCPAHHHHHLCMHVAASAARRGRAPLLLPKEQLSCTREAPQDQQSWCALPGRLDHLRVRMRPQACSNNVNTKCWSVMHCRITSLGRRACWMDVRLLPIASTTSKAGAGAALRAYSTKLAAVSVITSNIRKFLYLAHTRKCRCWQDTGRKASVFG